VLLVSTKEVGVEAKYEKTKYICVSQQQNARKHHNITTDNKSPENVATL